MRTASLAMAKRGPSGDGLKARATERRWGNASAQAESLRASAGRMLEEMRAKRANAPATARKPKKPKASGKEIGEINALVSPEARRHGDYQMVDFKLQEVVEGGKLKAKTTRAVRNLASTQVDRWLARGRLDERQMAAILFYQEAWRIWIGEPRITANYSPAIRRGANQAVELWASSRMRAKEGLRLLDQEVFFREPVEHFEVWQNVVIWDEAAGVAGSKIGFCYKPAEAVAQLIVQSLAHKIAEIVIDSSRHDFGDLLIDLDAPRRPGRRRA